METELGLSPEIYHLLFSQPLFRPYIYIYIYIYTQKVHIKHRNNVGYRDHHSVCVCVCVCMFQPPPPHPPTHFIFQPPDRISRNFLWSLRYLRATQPHAFRFTTISNNRLVYARTFEVGTTLATIEGTEMTCGNTAC